ncbi:hypothetical protein ACVWW2_008287 [Bradyrhizobium sp. LM4.3]
MAPGQWNGIDNDRAFLMVGVVSYLTGRLTGLSPARVLASIGPRNRRLGWDALSASQAPARATNHEGVTDVVPLHHQVYPRLPDRLSCCDRLGRGAVRAEARPERTGRNVAFACRRCGRVDLGRPDRPSHPGSFASFPTGCIFGSIALSGWCLSSHRLPSNSLGSTPGTTGSSLPPSCSRRQS